MISWLVLAVVAAALVLAWLVIEREPAPEPEQDDELAERDAADHSRPLGNVTVLGYRKARR